jgi:hypothetical protein
MSTASSIKVGPFPLEVGGTVGIKLDFKNRLDIGDTIDTVLSCIVMNITSGLEEAARITLPLEFTNSQIVEFVFESDADVIARYEVHIWIASVDGFKRKGIVQIWTKED